MPRRLLDRIVAFREGEATTAWLMFAYSFLAMTAYNILKPITRSKFISALGADNLPYVLLVAGLLIGVLMQAYSQVAARLPRKWVLPATQGGLVVLMLAFWGLFRTGAAWVSVAFYVFGLMLGLLLISQFWTLANDIYDSRQARRLFGFIGGGASLGSAMAATIIMTVVARIGTNNLLLVSAFSLAVCTAIVTLIVRRQPVSAGVGVVEERGVGGGEAFRLLRSSRHLQVIALVIACASIGAGIIDQQFNMAAEATRGSENDLTLFFAQVTLYLSLAGLFIQVVLTSRIHRSLGLVFALLLLPVSLGATGALILLTGAVWAPAAARVLDTSLRYTIDKTTREVLFLPLPTDLKYRAKPFVDVTVDRFARAVCAVLLLVLIKPAPWGFGLDWRQLSYASLAVMALWIGLALVARRGYLRTFRLSIGAREMQPAAVRVDVADAATIETLVEELANPDDLSVLYAIDMLETLDKRHLITPLLLHHDSPKVRARALVALESARAAPGDRWIPAVERMLKDEDADVRAAAVRALAALRHADAPALMHAFLDDANPRVAVTAAAVLADAAGADHARAAETTIAQIVGDTRTVAAAGRRDAAAALARVRNPAFRSLLIPLIHDPDVDVAREAVRTARTMGPGDGLFVPALVSLLGHRVLKAPAREALVSYGERVIDLLAHVLTDRDEQAWVRRHVPATLALLPTQRSMDALVGALGDADGFLRYKIIEALDGLRRAHPALTPPPQVAETLVVRESGRYYRYLTLQWQLAEQAPASRASLLARALDDKLARTLDRLYRLLGLVYAWQDVADARYSIEHGDPRARAAALEYLEGLLSAPLRRRIMPIVDEAPLADKVRHAQAVLKTRPRDLADTVAQLIHEDDPVVAAAAVGFVEDQRLWGLADDLEYVRTHGAAADRWVVEAAAHALACGATADSGPETGTPTSLPVVQLADRLRAIALFNVVSIDELFRIAATGQQIRYERGREVSEQGAPADAVQFLLEGVIHDAGTGASTHAPAALGFEEMLEGRAWRSTMTAAAPAVCLRIGAADLLTMIADNTHLAQGLFRMLLAAPADRGWGMAPARPMASARDGGRERALEPVEKALRLRENPLLGRATVEQLLTLVSIARDVPLTAGRVLFSEQDRPAVFHVLDGEVRVEADGAAPMTAGPGATVGVAETLAGISPRGRAIVTRDGHALRLDRDELFVVLADHVDLLQGVFSGVLHARGAAPDGRGRSQ